MATDIDTRLRGTRRGLIVQEFFTNSGHFPMAIIFFEFLTEGLLGYLAKPDPYITLLAGLSQAVFIGSARYAGKPRPVIGNLIGPALYTAVEVAMEGLEFFERPHHLIYWGVSLAIGLLGWLQPRVGWSVARLAILVENVLRTSIVLVMYWAFESLADQVGAMQAFLADNSHVFIAILIPIVGVFVGLASADAARYLALLRKIADQLRTYSEWFFGRDLLSQAVADPGVLTLQRRQRAVLFMDIRGFTHWSEPRSPEEVVDMLNAYFETAEGVWSAANPIKVKLSADEVMLILAEARPAAALALRLSDATRALLSQHHLAAGIGLHVGPLVEGLVGSPNVRGYDVIGDTVNTAKRLCDAAQGGQILISQAVRDALDDRLNVEPARQLQVKGKDQPLTVYELCPS